jgi:hypothetical protein
MVDNQAQKLDEQYKRKTEIAYMDRMKEDLKKIGWLVVKKKVGADIDGITVGARLIEELIVYITEYRTELWTGAKADTGGIGSWIAKKSKTLFEAVLEGDTETVRRMEVEAESGKRIRIV